jgi:alpha-galactosidase
MHMLTETLSTFHISDTTIRFQLDRAKGRIGMELFPTALAGQLVAKRETLRGEPEIDLLPGSPQVPARSIDPLVHLKIVGDWYPGAFAQGRTMRNSASNDRFKFEQQHVRNDAGKTTVITTLRSDAGHRIEHRLAWHDGDAAAEVVTIFHNDSSKPVTLEMLTSVSLGGITPFHAADAPGRLRVHRFRSVWSAEGRLDTQSIEQLHLERSWSGSGLFSERFGQLGSMPVRGWFPFVAVEDTVAGVLWGAQIAWAGSWQLEIFREHDDVCISGGLADREFGHWMKTLPPGESLATPPATLSCVAGTLDDLCDRLTALQQRAADHQPAIEHDLPIVFNEWCTTWGDPSHEKLLAIADRLKGSEAKYLVIDAGWYKTDRGNWDTGHGDWIPSSKLFPDGLAATAAAIRQRGLVPGLWFEMETCGENSTAFSLADHMLQRDGIPISVRSRRFWNLNDARSVDYLTARVIDLLEKCNFGYLKVDYNETIGLGCDGESQGEGLRRQILGIYRFFDHIRHRLPNLVIENCSSGGHRLEPSMIGRTAMSSFSDAHELKEIPIIAANLHRLMLPRQSQIWAVLHPSDSDQRLAYSLAATFLGRMCLSGQIAELTATQWDIVRRAQHLYRAAAQIIKHGTSRRFGQMGESWRHPTGWQGILRVAANGTQALAVIHAFAAAPKELGLPLPHGRVWRIADQFSVGPNRASVDGHCLACSCDGDFTARVVLLTS